MLDLLNTLGKKEEHTEEIIAFKKEIAHDIIKKIKDSDEQSIFFGLGEELIKDYLVDEGFMDRIKDFTIEKGIELLHQSFLLKSYREQLTKLSTKEELEVFHTSLTTPSNSLTTQISTTSSTNHESGNDQTTNTQVTKNNKKLSQIADDPTTEYKQKIQSQQIENHFTRLPSFQQYEQLQGVEKPDFMPFMYALQGYEKMQSSLGNTRYLTIVDYSKPNTANRFFVIDMTTNTVVHAVPVGHGKKSGGTYAQNFSNTEGSNQSSLGFFTTPQKITKAHSKKWHGLLMQGLENSNDNATNRGIYIHPGSVKGSEGCFTLPKDSDTILKKLQGQSLLFSYYPDHNYIAESKIIKPLHSDTQTMAA